MASKNMTTIMALFLTFNLVFLGFTSAQPLCPLNQSDLGICVNVLGLINLTTSNVAQCCSILSGLNAPLVSVCACEAIRLNVLNLLGITVNLNLRLNGLLGLCRLPIQPGFTCLA
ncbi:Hydrophobic seed protein domain [Arabidopsis suecica]|uniref:Hydrophobic seed protein domain n=1 Tax=Arabidopsis suecica TaxID=45249 RepID=A0A8T1YK24_ARASU|nr:Hydrophobic seed protein domain [Arabidopsis suecica]